MNDHIIKKISSDMSQVANTKPEFFSVHICKCADCGTVVKVPCLNKKQRATCPRCDATLNVGGRWSLKRCAIIAFSIAILMPFALGFPLLSIELLGIDIDASVWQGVWKMATEGYPYTAFLIFICAIVMPVFFILLIILLSLAQWQKIKPHNVLLSITYIKPWVMIDVYLVSLCVAAFKVREYASIHFDINTLAFILTTVLITLLITKIDIYQIWNDFYPQNKKIAENHNIDDFHVCTACENTFIEYGLDRKNRRICPRCLSKVDLDPTGSLQRTWATLIAGVIMLFPANLYSISTIYVNGAPNESSLMGGVILFFNSGSYVVAFIVFVASIFIPVSKIIIMVYLLCCVHWRKKHNIRMQMKLLHLVHFVGRWSMLDLFVLSLMMSLVNRGQIINFSVGPAAFYFGATVFLTMISASQFDSRLLWNIYDKQQSK